MLLDPIVNPCIIFHTSSCFLDDIYERSWRLVHYMQPPSRVLPKYYHLQILYREILYPLTLSLYSELSHRMVSPTLALSSCEFLPLLNCLSPYIIELHKISHHSILYFVLFASILPLE